MQHYPQPSSELTKHIPLEKVPPLYGGRCAALSLDIIIIGAGISGLAATHALAHAKHRITLLDSTSVLSAGIQVSPNAVRLLHHWGLGRALAEVAVGSIDMIRVPASRYTRWGTRMIEYHGYLYDLTNQSVYLRRKGYPVRQPLKNHPA
jgi:salicylate hydroxylase